MEDSKHFVGLPSFLVKLHSMLRDEDYIEWMPDGVSFLITDKEAFSQTVLPKYFRTSNFASFQRQENIYGFHKEYTDRLQFRNELFRKGHPELLKHIVRNDGSDRQRKIAQEKLGEFFGLQDGHRNMRCPMPLTASKLPPAAQEIAGESQAIVVLKQQLADAQAKQQALQSTLEKVVSTLGTLCSDDEFQSTAVGAKRKRLSSDDESLNGSDTTMGTDSEISVSEFDFDTFSLLDSDEEFSDVPTLPHDIFEQLLTEAQTMPTITPEANAWVDDMVVALDAPAPTSYPDVLQMKSQADSMIEQLRSRLAR